MIVLEIAVLSTLDIQSIKLPRYCYFRETNLLVALKEIRLQEEEGIPFTAIREGKYSTGKLHNSAGKTNWKKAIKSLER